LSQVSKNLELSEDGPLLDGLSFLTVKSRSLRGWADITLFVPEQARGLRNVPLVILLHGVHGSHWAWSIKGGAHRTAQRLINQGRIPPLVLAMPSDGLRGDGSGYLPFPNQNIEKWIVEDVPRAVARGAACLSGKSPLFLCGLSMGGFGALRIGAKYPALYRGISGHSSVTHFEQMLKFVEKGLALHTPAQDCSVLEAMLRHRATLPPIRFDCGTEDSLLKHNRQLHRDLEAHGIAHHYEEFPGGHDWNYWSAHLEDSLRFFREILTAPKRSH
jgi:enterochelin esterase-like enzyme